MVSSKPSARMDARVAFGDLVECVNDRIDNPAEAGVERYVGLEHLDPDSLTIRRWGTPADVSATKLRFSPGDIIFGRRRVYQRKLAVADFQGICSAHAMVLRAKPGVLEPMFLPFFMQSEIFMERAIAISVGSLSPTINWRTLARQEFILPPLHEQRRIAHALALVTEMIEKLRHTQDRLVQLEAATTEEVLCRQSHNWEPVAKLLSESPRNGISPATNTDGRGLRTVRIGAVDSGIFDPIGYVKHAAIDIANAEPFLVQSGDTFVVRGNGNRRLCGKAGVSNCSYDDLFYPDLLIRLRFDKSRILPGFAVAQWNVPRVHRRLSARAKSTNGTWKINGQDICAHELAVPPLDQQRSVIHCIRQIRYGVDSLNRFVASAMRLKSTLLNPLDMPHLPKLGSAI